MTKRTVSYPDDEHFKVRVVVPNALLHLVSTDEPTVTYAGDRIVHVEARWLDDPDKGDTLGFIHWPSVTAITWRWTGRPENPPAEEPRDQHRRASTAPNHQPDPRLDMRGL